MKLAAVFLFLSAAMAAEPAIDIGSRRELFLDHLLIDRLSGTELRLQTPVEKEVSMTFSEPWEGPFVNYATVIHDGPRYRLYYRGVLPAAGGREAVTVTCYAESADGIHWTRPNLGLVEVGGSHANNVILSDRDYSINFSPLLDTRPGVDPGERYKAVGGTMQSGLVAFASADGIHWRKMRDEPVLPKSATMMYDSQNLAFWSESEGRYVCYFRTFRNVPEMGAVRWISRTTSRDFLHWEAPVEMTFGDAPPEHLYVNQTAPYFRAPHLYVATGARFVTRRRVLTDRQARETGVDKDYRGQTSDVVLLTTRGGSTYQRAFLESFLRPGIGYSHWVSRTNYPALNLVQTGPAEMSLYVDRNYAQSTAHLRRYALRLDGFASLHAGFGGGEMVTKPLRFTGDALELNYATSAAGVVRVEIQDMEGRPLPGFALADSSEIIGDEIRRTASWKSGADLGKLAGTPVRLRFVLKDADVFSFRFHGQGNAASDRRTLAKGR